MCPTFLLYPYSANNYALKGKRKTLNAQDVMSAMKDMEFEEFVEPLEIALEGRLCMYNSNYSYLTYYMYFVSSQICS